MATKPANIGDELRVYYVRLDMAEIHRIYEFYMHQEPNVARVNVLKNYYAFGTGFHLRWADRLDIEDDARYDYKDRLLRLLNTARQWRDMFGFVPFIDQRRLKRRPRGTAKVGAFNVGGAGTDDSQLHERMRARVARNIDETERLLGVIGAKRRKRDDVEANTDERQLSSQRRDGTATSTSADSAHLDQTTLDPGGKPPARRVVEEREAAESGMPRKRAKLRRREGTAARRAPSADVVENAEERRVGLAPQLSVEDLLASFDAVRVPDPYEGTFYLEVDPAFGGTKRVVFVLNDRGIDPTLGFGGGGGTALHGANVVRQIDEDASVHVYVWPGRMPDSRGTLSTPLREALRLRELMRESEENTMDADYALAHPTMFIETGRSGARAAAATEMSDTALYARHSVGSGSATAANEMTPAQEAAYRDNVRQSVLLEERTSAFNHAVIHGQAERAFTGRAHLSVPGHDGKARAAQRRRTYDQTGLMELPSGMTVGRTVDSKVTASMTDLRLQYKTELMAVLGVPRDFVEGTAANGGAKVTGRSRTSSASTEQTQALLRTTVASERAELATFFEELWDTLHRPSDNLELANRLTRIAGVQRTVEARLRAAFSHYEAVLEEAADRDGGELGELDATVSDLASEHARFQRLRAEVERAIQLPLRMRIKFNSAAIMGADEITALSEHGALSRLEEVNMMRARLVLPPIDEAELRRNDEERLAEEVRRTKALAEAANTANGTPVKKK